MTTNQKILICLLLFLTWLGLVFLEMAPVDDFVKAIQAALIGFGAYQARTLEKAAP
ncbi:MAG: hypothetical protein IPL29_02355 [Propionivibrio sp.]|nr:hypothetical protein [Propionivibrio sp.]